MKYRTEAPAVPALAWAESHTPTRAPSLRSDVAVPLAQAAITGALGAAPFAAVVAILGGDPGAAWLAWGGCAAIFTVPAWVWRLRSAERSLWAAELARGQEPADQGKPAPAVRSVAHLVATGGVRAERHDLELSDWEHVIQRAYVVGLSFRQWIGHRLPSGRVLDEDAWRAQLAELARLGVVEVRGDRRAARLAVTLPAAMQAFGFQAPA